MNAESEKTDGTDVPPSPEQNGEQPQNGKSEPAAESATETSLDPLAAAEAEVAALKDKLLRAMAELENFRRRAEKERQDISKFAISSFARDCLTVVDNLRRGLDSVSAEERKASPTLEALAAGMELTEREMLATLERHGIEKVDPLGEPFDHNFHQAMLEVEDDSRPAGSVAQVMQAGYVLNGRLLRPAMVAVAKGSAKNAAEGGQGEASAEADGPPVQAPIANEDLANPPEGAPNPDTKKPTRGEPG